MDLIIHSNKKHHNPKIVTLELNGTPVVLCNLLQKDGKSRSSGAGFEPAAYGFEDQDSENWKML
jgi:hypothetical protein